MIVHRRIVKHCWIIGVVLLCIGSMSLWALGRDEDLQEGSGNQLLISNTSPPSASTAPALRTLQDIQNAFEVVAQQVLPVVVEINTLETVERGLLNSPFDFFFGPRFQQPEEFQRPGLGSGVIVRRDGRTVYVLTNDHVVGDADEIKVGLYDRREFEAVVVGSDARYDLALVSFQTDEEVPIAVLGDSDGLRVGHWVLAIGNPLGFDSTVTAGIVSAVSREANENSAISNFTNYIQTDAAINQGNSGGALTNLNGEIVGINSWIASTSGGSIGLGFAIPINNAKIIIEDFITEGGVVYGWLGVSLYDVNNPNDLVEVAESLGVDETSGVLVSNVYRQSPAQNGGLLPGDFITHIDGEVVEDQTYLSRTIGLKKPQERIMLGIVRNGQSRTLSFQLGRRLLEDTPDDDDLWPGVLVSDLSDEIKRRQQIEDNVRGVIVVLVTEETAAEASANLRVGDIITNINNVRIRNVADFYRHINSNTINLQYIRGTRERNTTLKSF